MANRPPTRENIYHAYPFGNTISSRIAAGIGVLLLSVPTVWADTPPATDQIDIGIFTAVEGKVAVTHPGLPSPIPAKIQDGVLFKDVIETNKESRSKALLNDDSILTVGEHSRVEITEHIYDPNKGVRSVVINLIKGKVRALVGKAFTGGGSKFEIHTPTAVAAARGTYFIVFHINGVSGITNVGTHGHVDFTSGGRSVPVPPGHFSVTPPGGGAPSPPAVNTGGGVPPQVANAVKGTEVKDSPKEESPKQMAMASGGTAPVPSSPSNLTVPGSGSSGAGSGSSGSGGEGSSPSTSSIPTGPTSSGTTSTVVVNVPIVTAAPEITEQTNPQPSPPPPPASPTPTSTPPPPSPSIDPVLQGFTDLTDNYIKKVTNSTETFNQTSSQTQSLNEHATNLIRQVLSASETYLNEVNMLTTNQELVTQAQTTTNTQTTNAVTLVGQLGFTVTLEPLVVALASPPPTSLSPSPEPEPTPPPPSPSPSPEPSPSPSPSPAPSPTPSPSPSPSPTPPPPPHSDIADWFKKILARLFNNFSDFLERIDKQEDHAIAKAESEHEKRLQQADEREQKKIEQALQKEADQIAKAEEEYKKALDKIDNDKGKNTDDLAQAEAKLKADLLKAAEIREAQVKRAQEIEEAKIAKAKVIEESRIVRAQVLELARVDRSGGKLVHRVSRTGDRYLAKLQAAGASQAELEEARRQINEKIAEAEERVRLAQLAAVEDDIVRKTAGLAQEREFFRKFGRLTTEQRSFLREQRKLNRHAGGEQRQAFKQQRELIKEQRKAIRQERKEARESKRIK